ncbi:MAG: hypothetical protein GX556_17815 [Fibrobacter sp.]|nr:hypothetical protein [Fibrobacter sp.]
MDFYKDAVVDATRMSPYEEDSSYTGRNHSFIEAHCSNYSFESNDANGVSQSRGHFSRVEDAEWVKFTDTDFDIKSVSCSDDEYGCYHIEPSSAFPTELARCGGQSQHLRIRLIQLLNEYYGDWKWVNDPTAKVNIVCHSNGGLLVTYALAYDSLYFNNGFAYTDATHAKNCYTVPEYHITGLGFRLADHVNQVITIDTPFDGSPLADKDGKAGSKLLEITNAVSTLSAEVVPAVMGFDPLTHIMMIGALEGIGRVILPIIAYDLTVNSSNTPIMRDFGPGSDFNKSIHESKPPMYSNGQTVPY